jgi:hypothetical protein
MSRFSRMNNVQYRTWAPPESPIRIEYSAQVLQEVRLESKHGDAGGVLFGVRHGNELRVLAARSLVDERDPRLAGLDPVGIFAVRTRGEIFLTESDLERFEEFKVSGAVALVVSGARGGFFVRETGGSVLAIKSYLEFPVPEGPPETALVHTPQPTPDEGENHSPARLLTLTWIGLGALAVFTIFVVMQSELKSRPPLGLTVRAADGQLRIAWNLAVSAGRGQLEIRDGARQTTIPMSASLAGATYIPSGGDVEVRLVVSEGGSQSRLETARFLVAEPLPSPEISQTQAAIAALETEVGRLRSTNQRSRSSVAELGSMIDRLTASTPAP